MKIGIITFHFPYNCGALMQCSALQKVLQDMGHEVTIIDYRPWYHQNRCTPIQNPHEKGLSKIRAAKGKVSFKRKGYLYAKGFLSSVYALRNYRELRKCDQVFWKFIHQHLKLSPLFRTYEELKAGAPACDLYICGSDQVWNYHLTGDQYDKAYFMKFGPESARRISYAASVRMDIAPKAEKVLPKLLEGIDCISLREMDSYDLIHASAPNTPICQSLDPTLLLGEEDYLPFMSQETLESEPYLLVYTVDSPETQEISNRTVEMLHKETGLKIIDCIRTPRKTRNDFERRLCGPAEFLWYIKHAQYIVTNSFHATVFSVLMEKHFVSMTFGAGAARITSFLNSVGLWDRYTDVEELALQIVKSEIEYGKVFQKLAKLREGSLNYLRLCTSIKDGKLLSERITLETSETDEEKEVQNVKWIDESGNPVLYRYKADCCGCTACAQICPRDAIIMRENVEGFLFPQVEKKKCIKCYSCISVCAYKKARDLIKTKGD